MDESRHMHTIHANRYTVEAKQMLRGAEKGGIFYFARFGKELVMGL